MGPNLAHDTYKDVLCLAMRAVWRVWLVCFQGRKILRTFLKAPCRELLKQLDLGLLLAAWP